MSIKALEAQDTPATAAPVSHVALAFPGRVAVSPTEFAEATGLSCWMVYQCLRRGEIPARRLGDRWLIPLSALDGWLAGRE